MEVGFNGFRETDEEGFGFIADLAFGFAFCAAPLFKRAGFRGVDIGEAEF